MAKKSYKGRRFEIELASRLSLWWTGGERDDVLWHTHDSGGRATRRSRRGKSTEGLHGDLCFTDPIAKPLLDFAAIEAKKGYGRLGHVMNILDAPDDAAQQLYESWFRQAQRAHLYSGSLTWLLITRRDRREPLVFMPSLAQYYLGMQPEEVQGRRELPHARFSFHCRSKDKRDSQYLHLLCLRLTDWLSVVRPENIKRVVEGGG